MEEPSVPPYRIRFYVIEDGHEPIREWLNALSRDGKRWVGFMLKEQLQAFGPDICNTTFGKTLGGGLSGSASTRMTVSSTSRSRSAMESATGPSKRFSMRSALWSGAMDTRAQNARVRLN